MYLNDIIEPLITEKLKEMCVGKQILFHDNYLNDEILVKCKDVYFESDDGDCWVIFIDEDNKEHMSFGQGIDIYFEIVNE